jgi:hypothetical protein
VVRGGVVDVDHEEPGFDARHVHRQDPARRDAVVVTRFHDRVPHRERVLDLHPDLEAEVAGVAGARDRDLAPVERVVHHAEILELVERLLAAAIEDRARLRALE